MMKNKIKRIRNSSIKIIMKKIKITTKANN